MVPCCSSPTPSWSRTHGNDGDNGDVDDGDDGDGDVDGNDGDNGDGDDDGNGNDGAPQQIQETHTVFRRCSNQCYKFVENIFVEIQEYPRDDLQ